jgi:hypothetical protein
MGGLLWVGSKVKAIPTREDRETTRVEKKPQQQLRVGLFISTHIVHMHI